jgi:hypothetical protein
MSNEEAVKRFRENFPTVVDPSYDTVVVAQIEKSESFLREELDKAREEERERIKKWIKEEQKEIDEHSGMKNEYKYAAIVTLDKTIEFIEELSP